MLTISKLCAQRAIDTPNTEQTCLDTPAHLHCLHDCLPVVGNGSAWPIAVCIDSLCNHSINQSIHSFIHLLCSLYHRIDELIVSFSVYFDQSTSFSFVSRTYASASRTKGAYLLLRNSVRPLLMFSNAGKQTICILTIRSQDSSNSAAQVPLADVRPNMLRRALCLLLHCRWPGREATTSAAASVQGASSAIVEWRPTLNPPNGQQQAIHTAVSLPEPVASQIMCSLVLVFTIYAVTPSTRLSYSSSSSTSRC